MKKICVLGAWEFLALSVSVWAADPSIADITDAFSISSLVSTVIGISIVGVGFVLAQSGALLIIRYLRRVTEPIYEMSEETFEEHEAFEQWEKEYWEDYAAQHARDKKGA